MIHANQKKFIISLQQKKFRILHKVFVVEGVKMVDELLEADFEIEQLYATTNWIAQRKNTSVEEVSEKELNSISSLKTPHEVLAVVRQRPTQVIANNIGLTLALDTIQDPGNFGTILRTADWFGIKQIVCSNNCVESYNPKVIQATMGAIFRLNISYTNLADFFIMHKDALVYGALLEGENVYEADLKSNGNILLMGNESQGISEELSSIISHPLMIPKLGQSESLNVASATAILCSEFARR